jgi:hypothetical protein
LIFPISEEIQHSTHSASWPVGDGEELVRGVVALKPTDIDPNTGELLQSYISLEDLMERGFSVLWKISWREDFQWIGVLTLMA